MFPPVSLYPQGAGVEVERESPAMVSPREVSLLHEILSQPPLCVECGGTLPRRPSELSCTGAPNTDEVRACAPPLFDNCTSSRYSCSYVVPFILILLLDCWIEVVFLLKLVCFGVLLKS